MRIYISADMEGIAGISRWNETEKGNSEYERYREQMTREVAAACEGAIEAGAEYILVKDAHDRGKNLIHELLPRNVKIMSGWSQHPYNMVEGIDESFDAAIFIGYHCGAYTSGSSLAHTLYPNRVRKMTINGDIADEFLMHAYICQMIGVPLVAVSGDGELIRHVKRFNHEIKTIAVQESYGGAMVSIHPDLAIERIRRSVKKRLAEGVHKDQMQLPDQFELIIEFKNFADAYKFSFYPKVKQLDDFSISYQSTNYMDILSLLLFLSE